MEFLQRIANMFGGINIQTKALLISFVGTIILGFIIIPILKKLKIGQVVRDDGPQSHLKKSGTPTMGRDHNAYNFNSGIFRYFI